MNRFDLTSTPAAAPVGGSQNRFNTGPSVYDVPGLGYLKPKAESKTVKPSVSRMGSATMLNAIGSYETKFLLDDTGKYRVPKDKNERYSYTNPKTGDLGYYQMQPATLAAQSKKLLGRVVSTEEYLSSPKLQDELSRKVMDSWGSQYPELSDEQLIKSWNVGLNGDFDGEKARTYHQRVSAGVDTKLPPPIPASVYDIPGLGYLKPTKTADSKSKSAGDLLSPGFKAPLDIDKKLLDFFKDKPIGAVVKAIGEAVKTGSADPLKTLLKSANRKLTPEETKEKLTSVEGGMDAVLGFTSFESGVVKTLGKGAIRELAAAKELPLIKGILRKAGVVLDEAGTWLDDLVKADKPQAVEKIIDAAETSGAITKIEAKAAQELSQTDQLLPKLPEVPQIESPDVLRGSLGVERGSSALPGTLSATDELVKATEKESVEKLTQALKEAKPLRGEQERLYTEARKERLSGVLRVRAETGGEAGYYRELGQLKGEMPKVEFESLRSKVGQDDIDNLFNMVRNTDVLSDFDKITARSGLSKMFGQEGGAVPTDGELKLLARVFPKEVLHELLAKRPFLTKLGEMVSNVLNVPRAIRSSVDLSAPFRQGIVMVGKKEFWKAIPTMFKQFASEAGFREAQTSIMRRPTFGLMEEAKLALTGMDELIVQREEQFMSNLAERVPILGRVVRASGRAYVGFLNKVRADVFDGLIQEAKRAGVEIDRPGFLDSMGRFINAATGRGGLGALESAAPVLNSFLFSPRLIASRIQMLNPHFYVKLDPFVRKEAIKAMIKFGGIAGTIATLAKLGGADVVADPRNADFGKIKFKAEGGVKGLITALPAFFGVGVQTYADKTRLDMFGGFQQYIRILAQLQSGQIVSSTTGKTLTLGEGYKPLTRKDILIRFFEGKLSPISSFVAQWLTGQDVVGNKFEFTPEVLELFVPMIKQDIQDALNPPGPIGGSGSSPSPTKPKAGNRFNL